MLFIIEGLIRIYSFLQGIQIGKIINRAVLNKTL